MGTQGDWKHVYISSIRFVVVLEHLQRIAGEGVGRLMRRGEMGLRTF